MKITNGVNGIKLRICCGTRRNVYKGNKVYKEKEIKPNSEVIEEES